MPVLDRQRVGEHGAPGAAMAAPAPVPRSVPEPRPTRLQKHYVLLSAPALVLGALAITYVEFGGGIGAPLVKLCAVIAAPLLAVANADAVVRIWRSAWAWMPVDRGRGLFRLTWTAAGVILCAILLVATWLVITT